MRSTPPASRPHAKMLCGARAEADAWSRSEVRVRVRVRGRGRGRGRVRVGVRLTTQAWSRWGSLWAASRLWCRWRASLGGRSRSSARTASMHQTCPPSCSWWRAAASILVRVRVRVRDRGSYP